MINKTDTRDATGFKPLDVKLITYMGKTQWRIAKVAPIKVGPDEYETKLRWYLPMNRKDRKLIIEHQMKQIIEMPSL